MTPILITEIICSSKCLKKCFVYVTFVVKLSVNSVNDFCVKRSKNSKIGKALDTPIVSKKVGLSYIKISLPLSKHMAKIDSFISYKFHSPTK